ncbi:hypothetical protein TRFO_34297 [Tritrichomonas foetus]|uniref:Surface antigen BspA-like n=1 Tax=Tritrichomonas foetus TaxID=1144522 RepID=A0A1J4JLL5_9EUKA|nr:hypothetical protein TRFO_34297 [Tritrichomonas foetus]|eukprot:OHS99295.1 hypothetical protein TRFO_34297 [Tritrichomonas foetus]
MQFVEEIHLNSLTSVESGTFRNLVNLKKVYLPKATIIYSEAFSGCISLQEVEIPLVETLNGNKIFYNCTSLSNLVLTKLTTLTSTGGELFYNCVSFDTISLGSTPPKTFNANVFTNRNSDRIMKLELPQPSDYQTYDDNTDIPGDAIGDGKWCGIELNINP